MDCNQETVLSDYGRRSIQEDYGIGWKDKWWHQDEAAKKERDQVPHWEQFQRAMRLGSQEDDIGNDWKKKELKV